MTNETVSKKSEMDAITQKSRSQNRSVSKSHKSQRSQNASNAPNSKKNFSDYGTQHTRIVPEQRQ